MSWPLEIGSYWTLKFPSSNNIEFPMGPSCAGRLGSRCGAGSSTSLGHVRCSHACCRVPRCVRQLISRSVQTGPVAKKGAAFTPAENAQMMALKAAFDPAGTLNPGKVIPTLQRCAEGGKMHVKKGLLPFADLPRF